MSETDRIRRQQTELQNDARERESRGESRRTCFACGLPIGPEVEYLTVAEGRFAHPDCVNAPRKDAQELGQDTIRALSEIAARGQGGPI